MPVGLVIVSHSAQLAAGVAELAGQMTQGKTAIAPAGGAGEGVLGTSVETILTAIQAVDGPDGVLVLLDLGSAILSAEMALEMLDDEQRGRVALSYAPIVEGAIAAAIESSLGRSLREVKQAAEKTAQAEQLRQLKPLSQEETMEESVAVQTPSIPVVKEASTAYMPEVQLTLNNPAGLHARPASLFVQTAARFKATVRVLAHKKQASAVSIMEVLALGVRQGDTITVSASGDEAQDALGALSELVRTNFYETAETPEPSPPEQANQASVVPVSRSDAETSSSTMAVAPQAPHEPWHGLPTSKGVAVAPAFLYTAQRPPLTSIERRPITPEQVPLEQQMLRNALKQGAQELTALAASVRDSVGASEAGIFEAQALMLADPALLDASLRMIDIEHIDAASAVASVGEQQAGMLAGLDDALLAARAVDVRDAVSRVVQHLRGQEEESGQALNAVQQPIILVARDLTPSDTVSLRPEVVRGICTVLGGPNAHAAILARSLGIPAIAGLNEAALSVIHTGDELGLDADNGLLYHQPSEDVRSRLVQRADELQERQAALKQAARQSQGPIMIDGRAIHLFANIANAAEAEAARQWGAEGVGLLRTEFLFAAARTLPDEQEQRRRYVQVFEAFKGNSSRPTGPIVVRTLDAGADKPLPALNDILGAHREENPALGLRGIRIHLAHQQLLEQQLRALLLAAADTGIELHIMFPMITTVEELTTARAIFDRVYAELLAQQVSLPSHVPVGIMVEVPAAAVMAPELASLADFFSIGANDLMQYTLASDRTNAAVAYLYHPMQPAVLRLIHTIAQAGRSAGKPGKLVAVCGEIGGDARLAPVLVALGVDELSMAPTALPAVRAALARWSTQSLAELARQVLQTKSVDEVAQLLQRD